MLVIGGSEIDIYYFYLIRSFSRVIIVELIFIYHALKLMADISNTEINYETGLLFIIYLVGLVFVAIIVRLLMACSGRLPKYINDSVTACTV